MEPKVVRCNIEVTSRQIPRLATSYRFSLILFIALLQFLSASQSVVGDTLGTLEMAAPNSADRGCCSFGEDPQQLYSCIKNNTWNTFNHQPANGASTVAIITFTTAQTISYASFALAINSAYAKRFGYAFRLFDLDDTGEIGDPRWIKIRLVKEALSQWARSYAYVVWLDSDLAIIDHSFRFEDVALANPNADMIMSKDMLTAPFVSNSGVIIVKNTLWSLNMLDLWWSSYDRDRCCDQNAFTWLYDRKLPADIQAKTALLPANAINSDFPAWLNQHNSDPILHLAGQSSIYRNVVFSTGFQHICEQESEGGVHKQQIGLTRDFLFRIMRSMNARRLDSVTALVQKTKQCPSSAVGVWSRSCAELARFIRGELEDVLKTDSDEPNHYNSDDHALVARVRVKEVMLRLWIARVLLKKAHEYFRPANGADTDQALVFDIDSSVSVTQQSVVFGEVRDAIGAVFETHIARKISASDIPVPSLAATINTAEDMHDDGTAESLSSVRVDIGDDGDGNRDEADSSNLSRSLLHRCLKMIEAVLSSALPLTAQVRGSFLYHRFKTLQFLAAGPLASGPQTLLTGNMSTSIHFLTSAVSDWQQMVQLDYFGGSGQYVLADPEKELTAVLSELALLHCLNDNHTAGVQLFLQSMELQRRMVEGYSRIRIATEDNVAAALATLADTTVNAATCFQRSDNKCDKTIYEKMMEHIRVLCSEPHLALKEPQKVILLKSTMHQLSSRCTGQTHLKKLKKVRKKVGY
eukprot:gene18796-21390_t